jgi:hypothetical protein
MPLHLTKVAFGAQALDDLLGWFRDRPAITRHTTRNQPRRHGEIVPGGSLYWILKHQLVARTPILGFEPSPDGRTDILISNALVRVRPIPCRAHQGWRYLEGDAAPADLADGEAGEVLPAALAGDLARLGLL